MQVYYALKSSSFFTIIASKFINSLWNRLGVFKLLIITYRYFHFQAGEKSVEEDVLKIIFLNNT